MKRGQEGSITVVLLMVFIGISMLLLAVYQLTVSDYVWLSKTMEEEENDWDEVSVVESAKPLLASDPLWEGDGLDVETSVGEEWSAWFDEYAVVPMEGEVVWNEWNQYTQGLDTEGNVNDQVRIYDVEDNGFDEKDHEVLGDVDIYNEEIQVVELPEKFYMKVVFDPGVYRLTMNWGTSFETETYEIRRVGSMVNEEGYVEEVYVIGDEEGERIPRSVTKIRVEGDASLGDTSISLLSHREIEWEVYEKDELGVVDKSQSPVYVVPWRVDMLSEGVRIDEREWKGRGE